MQKVRLLLIDEKMQTAEVELEPWLFKQLRITSDLVKRHESKSSLNRCVTEFLAKKDSEEGNS